MRWDLTTIRITPTTLIHPGDQKDSSLPLLNEIRERWRMILDFSDEVKAEGIQARPRGSYATGRSDDDDIKFLSLVHYRTNWKNRKQSLNTADAEVKWPWSELWIQNYAPFGCRFVQSRMRIKNLSLIFSWVEMEKGEWRFCLVKESNLC